MVTLEDKMAALDQQLRAWTMPAHLAKDIERGEAAKAEHERQRQALLKERAELAEAMKRQVSAAEYEKKKAEREAKEAAIAQAVEALRQAADEYTHTFDEVVTDLRSAAAGVGRLLAQMKILGQIGQSLTKDGRVPHSCDSAHMAREISLLIAAAFRAVPGHRWRLGLLTWPDLADAHYLPGDDWAEKERARVERVIVAPLVEGER